MFLPLINKNPPAPRDRMQGVEKRDRFSIVVEIERFPKFGQEYERKRPEAYKARENGNSDGQTPHEHIGFSFQDY